MVEIELRERFLSRNEIEVGTYERLKVLGAINLVKKSKKGTNYQVCELKCVDTHKEEVVLSCFSTELKSCVLKWGRNTDAWVGHEVDAYNVETYGGRNVWKVIPSPTEELVD